ADARAVMMDHGILLVRLQDVGLGSGEGLHFAQALSRRGTSIGPVETIGDGAAVDPLEETPELASGGDRALAVWRFNSFVAADERLVGRVIDSYGRPLSPPLDLSATAPPGTSPGAPMLQHAVAWDGERFAVFWNTQAAPNQLLMTMVEADGATSPVATVVLADLDGNESNISRIRGFWTGDRYVLAVTHSGAGGEANLYVLAVNRDGVLLQNAPIASNSTFLRGSLGDDRVLFTWKEGGLTTDYIRAVLVTLDGTPVVPPGVLSLAEWPSGFVRRPEAGWSGEEFLVVFGEQTFQQNDIWHVVRLLSDGTILDPDPVRLFNRDTLFVEQVLWSGRDWLFFALQTGAPLQLALYRLECSCNDQDGDGFDACVADDCDDRDPFAYPEALELCSGGADEDCDGLFDCADPDCAPAGSAPTAITDLRSDGTTWTWTAPAGTDRYDLARGLVSELRQRGDFYNADCAGRELVGSSWYDDGRNPASGEVLWYLVRAEDAPCAFGTWNDNATAVVNVCD
ncbi:MAG: hypothetical protein KJP18_10885, partial [Gemmatimonadetes bacterium]|nr:hypothetical protein [Gemmatimonadota bacterium]